MLVRFRSFDRLVPPRLFHRLTSPLPRRFFLPTLVLSAQGGSTWTIDRGNRDGNVVGRTASAYRRFVHADYRFPRQGAGCYCRRSGRLVNQPVRARRTLVAPVTARALSLHTRLLSCWSTTFSNHVKPPWPRTRRCLDHSTSSRRFTKVGTTPADAQHHDRQRVVISVIDALGSLQRALGHPTGCKGDSSRLRSREFPKFRNPAVWIVPTTCDLRFRLLICRDYCRLGF